MQRHWVIIKVFEISLFPWQQFPKNDRNDNDMDDN